MISVQSYVLNMFWVLSSWYAPQEACTHCHSKTSLKEHILPVFFILWAVQKNVHSLTVFLITLHEKHGFILLLFRLIDLPSLQILMNVGNLIFLPMLFRVYFPSGVKVHVLSQLQKHWKSRFHMNSWSAYFVVGSISSCESYWWRPSGLVL